jgi:outer membrane protein assembly factor BamA
LASPAWAAGESNLSCLDQPIASVSSPVFHKVELGRLEQALGIAVGRYLDLRRLDDAIRNLFSQGNLQTIFIEADCGDGSLRLTLRGARVRVLRHLVFHEIDGNVADDVKHKANLEEGRSTDLRAFGIVRDRLKEIYRQRGYYQAEPEISISEIEQTNEADVDVSVVPGRPTLVGKITVSGGTKDEDNRMRELLQLHKGDVFSRPALDDSVARINDFLRTNMYSTSKVEEAGVTFNDDKSEVEIQILVHMGERFQYYFSGNRIFDDYELRALLTPEVLARSDATSRVIELIEEKYRAAGFHFVAIRPDVSTDAAERLNIVNLDISEGERVRIDRVTFSSTGELSKDELESLLFDDAPGVLSRYLYWEAGFKEAIATFQKKLQAMGFLSSRVSEPKPIFTDDKRGVELFFDLDLGTRTYVSQVEFDGATHIAPSRLQDQLLFKIGQPINRQLVIDSRKRILDLYASEGFTDAKFQDTAGDGIVISRDQKVAVIRMPITEGTQYFVGQVTIEGTRRTRPSVILREMRLHTGDRFDPERLQRSEEEIRAIGLFARVEMVQTTEPGHPDRKDIKVVVRESPPGVGEVGLGAEYEDPSLRLRTFGGVAYRNLFGLNQTLSARTEVSLPITTGQNYSASTPVIPFVEYSALLSYRAPYPFELPFTYTGQIGLERFETSIIALSVLTRARLDNKVEKKFTPWFTGIYRLHHFERNYTHEENPLPGSPADVFETIGSTGPGLVLDFRNDPFNPTKGTYHTLDLEFAHPYLLSESNIGFYMALSRNSVYVPLFSPFSFVFYLGLGYAQSLSGFGPLPEARLLNELALGGQSSIRGIGFHAITALNNNGYTGDFLNVTANSTYRVGLYNARAELNTELVTNLSMATFFDAGKLFADSGNLDGQGFGVGLRYKTPVGPAVIDVAQGLGQYKQAVQFYFTVGTL